MVRGIVEKYGSGYLVQPDLVDEQFLIGVEVGLHYIYLLLYLLRYLAYLVLVAPCRYGVFVYVLDA